MSSLFTVYERRWTNPTAKPNAGSTRNSACRTNDPVTGSKVVTSPSANCTAQTTRPIVAYPSNAPKGPPVWIEPPRPRKSPVPCNYVSSCLI